MSKASFVTSVSIHNGYTSSILQSGSSTVFIEGKPAARVGDLFLQHVLLSLPHTVHIPLIQSGSSTVFIEGKPAARVGDLLNCGGNILSGASTVDIG